MRLARSDARSGGRVRPVGGGLRAARRRRELHVAATECERRGLGGRLALAPASAAGAAGLRLALPRLDALLFHADRTRHLHEATH